MIHEKSLHSHWHNSKRVLRHLKKNQRTQFGLPTWRQHQCHWKMGLDWSSNYNNGRSTNGYFCQLRLGGGAKCWQSKTQQKVAFSLCEPEHPVLIAPVQEETLLRSLLCGVSYEHSQQPMFEKNNKSCIKLQTKYLMRKSSKHHEKKFHIIREKLEVKQLNIFIHQLIN